MDEKFNNLRFGDQDEIKRNPELQEYLKFMYEQIKAENKLLGDFSVYGTYKIKQGMIACLIKEGKIFQERHGNVVYATRVLEDVILNFEIIFDNIDKPTKAELFLIEREFRYDDDNIFHRTKLAEIVKPNMPKFIEYVYKAWNVWVSFQDFALEDDIILRQIRLQMSRFAALAEMMNISGHLFVLSILPILKNMGKKGLNIYNKYNKMLKIQMAKNPNFVKNGTNLKRMLDQILRKNSFFKEFSSSATHVFGDFANSVKDFEMKFEKKAPQKTLDLQL